MAVYRLGELSPRLSPSTWVAPGATVIGDVVLEEQTSVWYGATLRGDNDRITIGRGSNVQEGSVLHTDHEAPLVVGEGVTVGHLVMLHGCTVGDGSLIGIRAVVLNHARIGRHCLVGAGALVTEGKVFPDGVLILGSPAKVVRELEPAEIEKLRYSAAHYVTQTQRHRDGLQALD